MPPGDGRSTRRPALGRALTLLLPIMLASESPAPVSEPELEDGFTLECLQGIGVEMLMANSMPAPVSDVNEALNIPPGEHPKWNQEWLDAYLERNPEFAGPTVYFPDRPPAISFDFTRSQPPDNRTLAEFLLDGTGIEWTEVEITDVQQTATGQLRISGTVANFQPGAEGYEAMVEFFTTLDGMCATTDRCSGEIVRVVATHNDDRIADGNSDANGNPTYWDTVDIEWRVHTRRDFSPSYRTSSFENRLARINALRGLTLGAIMTPLGRSALLGPTGVPFEGQEADSMYPVSKALTQDVQGGGRPDYPLPFYNTSYAFHVGVSSICTPQLASTLLFNRYDANLDQKISGLELIGMIQEMNGTVLEIEESYRWLRAADYMYYNARNARPVGAVCTGTEEELAAGCDNLLSFVELKEVLPGFFQDKARCVRKSSEDLFGNPKDEYMCVKKVLFAPFIYKNDHFTKTGSGQT
jgi:hypothetical protein